MKTQLIKSILATKTHTDAENMIAHVAANHPELAEVANAQTCFLLAKQTGNMAYAARCNLIQACSSADGETLWA